MFLSFFVFAFSRMFFFYKSKVLFDSKCGKWYSVKQPLKTECYTNLRLVVQQVLKTC